MVKLELMNTVLLAEDYARMRDWYLAALDLELKAEWTESYHYSELAREGRLVIGIAPKAESKKHVRVALFPKEGFLGA